MSSIVSEVCLQAEQGTGEDFVPGLFASRTSDGDVVLTNFSTLAPVQEQLARYAGMHTFEHVLNCEQREKLLAAGGPEGTLIHEQQHAFTRAEIEQWFMNVVARDDKPHRVTALYCLAGLPVQAWLLYDRTTGQFIGSMEVAHLVFERKPGILGLCRTVEQS